MFRRIVIPWDTSSHAPTTQQDTLVLACSIAQRTGAAIALAHIISTSGDGGRDGGRDAEERDAIARVAQRLRDDGLDAEAIVAHGPIVEGLARVAQQTHADLVALTPRQRGPLDAAWRPNIIGQLFAALPLPALITPPAAAPDAACQRSLHLLSDPIATVIVPLDGSELAERALPYAQAFAEEYHRLLLLTRVVQPTVTYVAPEANMLLADMEQADEQEALRYLHETRARLAQQATQPVQVMLRVGRPADEIRQLLETHAGSLLVMSTHGRTGMSRAVMGSVTADVMRHALGPMLVIPPRCPPLSRDHLVASTRADTFANLGQ